jgi:hypothetical protein
MILADNGSGIFISGAPDNRWNNSDLNLLKSITASDFEVVQTGTIFTPANVPTGPSPTISSFTANPSTFSAGQPVTLSWNVSNSIYNIIDPQVGPVRGTSVIVNPPATTTYTLYTTNQFGRIQRLLRLQSSRLVCEVSASMRAAFEKLSFLELHHTAGLRRCHSVACS